MIEAEHIAPNGRTPQHDADVTVAGPSSALTPRDLMVIDVLDRMERLYRDQVNSRDRELSLKDRLMEEYERRAERAEQQVASLHEYISKLPPDPAHSVDPTQRDAKHPRRFRFWK